MIFRLVVVRLDRRIRKDRSGNTAKVMNVFQPYPHLLAFAIRFRPEKDKASGGTYSIELQPSGQPDRSCRVKAQ